MSVSAVLLMQMLFSNGGKSKINALNKRSQTSNLYLIQITVLASEQNNKLITVVQSNAKYLSSTLAYLCHATATTVLNILKAIIY